MSKKKIVYIKKSDAIRYAEWEGAYKAVMYIADLPAEDVRPQKHGKWLSTDNDNYVKCSKCKLRIDQIYPYCPNCGAIMDSMEGEKK